MEANKKIVLIGAGNVATHLGMELQRCGYPILQVYSRTEASASELAKRLSVPFTTSFEDVCQNADVYIVALKDSVLQEKLPYIIKGKENALFVHTAGSMPMDIWKGWVSRYGVLYPMQTFSKNRKLNFKEVSFFIEAGERTDLQTIRELALSLSSKVYEATSEQRKYLHIAAVFACNFTNHMYALSEQLLNQYHLPFDAMLPLIDETAKKVHELSPREAQTGPAVRYDKNVIEKHLDLLSYNPEVQELYEKISMNIHRYEEL